MKIRIFDKRLIPGLGRGPFNEPVEVSEYLYNTLVLGGYNIRKYKEPSYSELGPKPSEVNIEKVIEEESNSTDKVEANPVEEVENTSEEVVEEESIEEANDSDVEEIEEESIEEEDEETSSESEEESADYSSMTVKELKTVLTEKGIKFAYNDNRSKLLGYLGIESN